jgi:hypothetical protein
LLVEESKKAKHVLPPPEGVGFTDPRLATLNDLETLVQDSDAMSDQQIYGKIGVCVLLTDIAGV